MLTKEDLLESKAKEFTGTRAERRRYVKELKKNMAIVDSFTPQQIAVIEQIASERECEGVKKAMGLVEIYNNTVEVCLKAYLYELNPYYTKGDIYSFIEGLASYINDYQSKNKFEGEKDMSDVKVKEDVKKYCKELLKNGKKDKENTENLIFKFPTISKASLMNTYHEVKESLEIDEATKYIFEKEKHKKIESKKSTKLKVKSIIIDGEFDSYTVNDEGISLLNLERSFTDLKDVEKFKQEEIKKITNLVDEVIEALSMKNNK